MKKRNIIITLIVLFALSLFCFAGCKSNSNSGGNNNKPKPDEPEIIDPNAAPSLKFDDLTLELGDEYVGQVKAVYGDKAYTGKADYVWTLADGATSGICSVVGKENGIVTVTAEAIGETEYTVSTTINGKYVNKAFKITVVERRIALIPEGNVTVEGDGYAIDLCTADYNGLKTEEKVTFTATDGKTDYGTVEIDWNVDGEDYDEYIATVSKSDNAYTFAKVGAGNTAILGTYTATNGATVTVKMYIRVEKAVKNIEFSSVIDLYHTPEVTLPSEIDGEVKAVTYEGTDVFKSFADGKVTLDAAKFPKTATKLGDNREIIYSTADFDYVAAADVYTMVIKTKEEVDVWGEVARTNGDINNTGTLDGYFVLGANIAYNAEFTAPTDCDEIYTINIKIGKGDSWQNTTRYGFKGVFDGKGYNIDGMTVKGRSKKGEGKASGGFVGYMNVDGVVRNVSFTNAGLWENSGFITSFGGGLTENVYVQFAWLGKGYETQNNERFMGAFYPYVIGSKYGKVVNCMVDAIGATIHPSALSLNLVRLGTSSGDVENLVVLTDNAALVAKSGATATASSYSEAVNGDCASVISEFGDEWTELNGLPFLKNYASELVENAEDIAISGAPAKLYGGMSATITLNEKFAGLTIENLPQGVTLDGNTLTVTDNAQNGTVTVTAKSYLNGSTATAQIQIVRAVAADVTSDVIKAEAKANSEVDLSFASDYLANTVKVRQGDNETDGVAVTNGKISIDLSAYTQKSSPVAFTIFSEVNNETYYFDVEIQPVNYLTTAQEVFDTFASGTVNGYYVLKNDVDMTDLTITAARATLAGVFDGEGHTINGLNFKGWTKPNFLQEVAFGGTLKNLAFTEVTMNGNSKGNSSIIAKNKGTIENVYVKYTLFNGNNQWYMSTFGNSQDGAGNSGTIKNVIVDFNNNIAGTPKAKDAYGNMLAMFAYLGNGATVTNAVVYGIPTAYKDFICNKPEQAYIVYADGTTSGAAIPTSGWDGEYWVTKSEGSVPFFKGFTAPSDKGFVDPAAEVEQGSSTEFTAKVLNVITLGSNAEELGVTLVNGVVTVPETAAVNATFKLQARNIFDYANPTEITVTVAEPLEKLEVESTFTADLNAAVVNGAVTVSDDDLTVDLTSVYTGNATDAVLFIGNLGIGTGNIANGVLTFTASQIPVTLYGEATLTVKISGDKKLVTVPLLIVTKTINTTAELQALKNYTDSETMQGGGYYRLSANISVGKWYTGSSKKDYRFGVAYPFKGTFDGNGFALDTVGIANSNASGFIHEMNGGTLKNVSFTNLATSIKCSIIYKGNGTIENVYVKYSIAGLAAWDGEPLMPNAGWGGAYYTTTFFSEEKVASDVTMTNVVVDLTETFKTVEGKDNFWDIAKVRALLGNVSTKSTVKNVAVIGANRSKIGSNGDGVNFNIVYDGSWNDGSKAGVYVYYQDDGSTNGVEFPANDWNDSYWTVDASARTINWKNA